MRHFQINGNLIQESELDYDKFCDVVCNVRNLYIKEFGEDLMNSIDLLIDNSTRGSGYTPNITPILCKYLIIKLNIKKEDTESNIIFQIAHELMHYVFYAIKGINKEMADEREESICTAASLIAIKEFYQQEFPLYYNHVKNLENKAYRKGAQIAESVEFNFQKLKELI